MNFAILDDNYDDLNITFIAVKDYIEKYNIKGTISIFTDYSKLSNHMEIDCYILDVILPNANGIELSYKLIQNNPTSKIIFVSSTAEYSPSAHRIKPIGYLIKPINKKEIFQLLDEVMKCFDFHFITVKDKGLHDRKIYVKDILFISPHDYKNNTLIHFANEKKLIAKMTYKQWLSVLDSLFFINSYKSVLVNIQNIDCIEDRTIIFNDGSTTTCSRKHKKELEQKYFDYLDDFTWHP